MSETQLALRWIIATLRGAGAVTALVGQRSYELGSIPTSATHPLIAVNWQGGTIAREVGQENLFSDDLWVVRGIMGGGGAMETLAPIADAIKAALHGKRSVAVSGGLIQTSTRVEQFRLSEPPVQGVVYHHLGGIYRIQAVQT
jgi:hypothetical protein